jgi:hypothetical protein
MNIRTHRPLLRARAYVHTEVFYRRNRRFPHRAISLLLTDDEARALRFWGEVEWRCRVAGAGPIPLWRRTLIAPAIRAARTWVNE